MQPEHLARASPRQQRVWLILLWGLGLAGVLFPLLSPRIWSVNFVAEREGLGSPWNLFRILRQLTLLGSILLIGWAVLEGLRTPRLRQAGFGLWVGALAFLLLSYLCTVLGTEPGFHPALLIVPPALTAVYLLEPIPLRDFIRHAKPVLLVYVYGSLGAMVIAPGWALEQSYEEGLIASMPWRLHGLAIHSNVLSPFLVTYLLVDLYSFRHTTLSWIHRSAALVCLILTQSKTALGALFIVLMLQRAWMALRERTLKHYLQLSSSILVLCVVALFLLAVQDVEDSVASNSSLMTLTGRTDIWRATLEIWRDNPWFGYGPTVFNIDMSPDYLGYSAEGQRYVVSAHNQFFQTLGASGAVGVVGLMIYLVCLLRYAVRYAGTTRGVSLALVLSLIIASISEPSLDVFIVGGSTLFVHLLTFSVLLLAAREPRP